MEVYVDEQGILRVKGANGGPPRAPALRAAGVPDVANIYGEGGLFGTCKHDPVLINATVGPIGFEAVMNWRGTNIENPIYEALTYIGTSTTDQASECADCGKPNFRRCAQSACFGRMCQQTNEMLFDDIGLRANQGVPTMTLFGAITDAAGNVLIGNGQQIDDIFVLNTIGAAYNLRLDVSGVLWTGDPANNLGGRREFPGYDLLINTGKVDVETQIACDALDSELLNFGSATVGAAGAPSIVAMVSALMRRIRNRAARANFNADSLVTYIVMHPNLWDCVAEAWACEYGLRCQSWTTANQRQMVNNALDVAALRDGFRDRMSLRIDGKDYPVVLDSQISQVRAGLTFCSDIYLITTQVDGRLVTYGEYQDMGMTAGSVIAYMRRNFGSTFVSVTDGGRFAIAPTTSGGYCFDVRVLTKPRIIMKMPWLSGRVQNVCCAPLGGSFPDVTGSGGLYELDGGAWWWPANYLYGDCWPLHGAGE